MAALILCFYHLRQKHRRPKFILSSCRPDFVFFARLPDGTVAADIIDPHGIQFGDAIPKLKGLADYAEAFGSQYRRIEAVAKIGDKFRALDLTEASTRAAVAAATSIRALYEGEAGTDYLG